MMQENVTVTAIIIKRNQLMAKLKLSGIRQLPAPNGWKTAQQRKIDRGFPHPEIKHPFLRATIIQADVPIDQPLSHVKAKVECNHLAGGLFSQNDKPRRLFCSDGLKELSIEPLKFCGRLFVGLPKQGKDLV